MQRKVLKIQNRRISSSRLNTYIKSVRPDISFVGSHSPTMNYSKVCLVLIATYNVLNACNYLFNYARGKNKIKENKCELCLAITPAFLSTMSNNSAGTEQYSAFWNLFLAQRNSNEAIK